jgi:hypothetical protein
MYYSVRLGQSILDVCLQVYGSLDFLSLFLSDNSLTLESTFLGGESVFYTPQYRQKSITQYLETNDIILKN